MISARREAIRKENTFSTSEVFTGIINYQTDICKTKLITLYGVTEQTGLIFRSSMGYGRSVLLISVILTRD